VRILDCAAHGPFLIARPVYGLNAIDESKGTFFLLVMPSFFGYVYLPREKAPQP
jgi:hypothetical protein